MSGNELMADFVFSSTYARYDHKSGRRETFAEAVDRMRDMHVRKYGHIGEEVIHTIDEAFSSVKNKEVLASQRALQFGGKPIETHHMRIYNCATSFCDRTRFFAEALYMGLCGVGVGFSVQKIHTDCLPALITREDWVTRISLEYVVEDSIEGWADALDALITSYLGDSALPDFDFSLIRPKGTPISAGGTAPGSEPLEIALEKIEELLVDRVQNLVTHLSPIDCFDILMFASEAVISGGRRRAATIALFDKDDKAMLTAKTGDWYSTHRHRALANISAVHLLDSDDSGDFLDLIESAKEYGEPGAVFTKSPHYVYNPCVEIGMCPILIRDEKGSVVQEYTLDHLNNKIKYLNKGYSYESGWQTCNLTEINGGKIGSADSLNRATRMATIIGTLQAGYTRHGYLEPVSTQIIEREALLGVSITGIMQRPEVLLDREALKTAATLAVETNKEFSKTIGIQPAARVTCVKPAGTTSIILGTSSGIHPHFGKRVIRHIQVNKDNPILKAFEGVNPDLCEESKWSEGGTDRVVAFPLEFPSNVKVKSDMTAIQFLESVRLVQECWVREGTSNPLSCEGLTHNVSNTVSVKDQEWSEVSEYLWRHRESLTGVAMLGDTGELCYPQLPNQAVYTPEELKDMELDDEALIYHLEGYFKWKALKERIKRVEYSKVYEDSDTTKPTQEVACSGQSCEVTHLG